MRSAVSPSERGSKVRAVLHADGTGSVSVAERYQAFNNETGAAEVRQIDECRCFQESVRFGFRLFFEIQRNSRFLTLRISDLISIAIRILNVFSTLTEIGRMGM